MHPPYLGKVVRNHVPNSPTLITDSVPDLHYKVLFDLGRRQLLRDCDQVLDG